MTDWPAMDRRGPHVSEAAVAALEASIGSTLPEDYRAFLLEVNGGRTARSARMFGLHHDQTSLNSLHSLDAPNERADLATRWRTARAWLPTEVLPIGSDDTGSTVVLAIAGPHRGEVWFLDQLNSRPEGSNPRVEWFARRDVVKLAPSFREFMASLEPLETDGIVM